METVSFKLPADLRVRLAREARRRQVPQSTIIRESLEKALGRVDGAKRDLTCADLAGNLIGSFAGPADLSTNPKYLRRALLEHRARRIKRRR